MSEFLIPFVISIFGLLAQAAAGKRQRRLVVAPAGGQPVAHRRTAVPAEQAPGSAVVDDFAIQPSTNYPTEAPKAESAPASDEVKIAAPEAETAGAPTASTTDSTTEAPQPTTSTTAVEAKVSPDATEVEAVTAEATTAKLQSESEVDQTSELRSESTAKSSNETVTAERGPTLVEVPEATAPESTSTASGSTSQASECTTTAPAAGAASVPPLSGAPKSASPNLPDFEYYVSRKPGIEYFLRVVIFLWFLGLALYFFLTNSGLTQTDLISPDPWVAQVTFATCALTGFTLVLSFRTALSYFFSIVESIFDVSVLSALTKNWTALKSTFEAKRVFVPTSVPHMVGFFIYVQTMFYLLSQMSPKQDFQMPGMPLPMPLPMDQLFSYNGLGLVTLAFCGAGIFVTRNFREVLGRLALVKPSAKQVGIGLAVVFMSFLYDYLWSLYTHGQSMGLDTKLSGYNGGTFTTEGGLTASLILALATALFAGVGEETLIRGGLQPMLGLVPAAILHGVLHAQFQHAPIFIVQVAGWSILMGIVKKYTNTTTTIIGHAGFNFLTTFLFSFNPPDL